MSTRRLTLKMAIGTAAGLALPGLRAQSATTKLLVGFAPGGSVDQTARALAERLRPLLNRQVVVENRPGAAGRLIIEATRQAAPNGDTWMLVPHGPMTLFPWIHRQLRYDPFKDFTPIGRICTTDYALSTGSATPAQTLAEFIAWAKVPGNKAAYGSPGAGTVPHFIGQGFAMQTQLDMTHVSYKGSALTMVDLMGGSLPLGSSPTADAIEHHRHGKVRILATTGEQRNPSLPQVPTLKESGVNFVMDGWYGVYAPADLPEELQLSFNKALSTAALGIEDMLKRNAMRPAPSTPAQLTELQRKEHQWWGPLVKASGFTPET
jgi:tripartite-type tricarboxylate transporter receptor subunit TctC